MLSSAQKVARMKSLMGEAGKNYYERIQLANEVIQDQTWLDSEHGGDSYAAAEILEQECFYDLSGSMSIFDMLLIIQKFPDEKEWAKNKYHLRNMLELAQPAPKESNNGARRKVKVADYEEAIQKQAELASEVKNVRRQLTKMEMDHSKLQRDYDKVIRENLVLKGRVEELENVLAMKFGGKRAAG